MFGLDPFSRPVAIIEILLLLSLAAFIGWLLAHLLFSSRIKGLQAAIADEEMALEACRRTTQNNTRQPRPMATYKDAAPTPIMSEPVHTLSTGNVEDATLARLSARSNELNHARLGAASAEEADDLKAIVGVGPFLEQKLHAVGIYTFRQVASLTREDIHQLSDIIEHFPDRIERENWVAQAHELYHRKYRS